jgi:hypothetical protein
MNPLAPGDWERGPMPSGAAITEQYWFFEGR